MDKLLYIDESGSQCRVFQRYAYEKFDVQVLEPSPDINDTIVAMLDIHPDAIVADFDLSDENPEVHYTGDDLINKFLSFRNHFPVFILTSYENDAISAGEDVNLVYEKKEMTSTDSLFLTRIQEQINKYRNRIEVSERRILELNKKKDLDAKEEEELSELDTFIESTLDKNATAPELLKSSAERNKLTQLVEKVDEFIKEFKK